MLKQNEKSRYCFNIRNQSLVLDSVSSVFPAKSVFYFLLQNCFKTWIGFHRFQFFLLKLSYILSCLFFLTLFHLFCQKVSFILSPETPISILRLSNFPFFSPSCLVWVIKPDLILQIDFGNTKNRTRFKLLSL